MPWPSQSPDLNPIKHMGDFGVAPETAFFTIINKTPNYGIYHGRMKLHPSNRVPDTCRIYAKVYWNCSGLRWPNALLRHFMLVFPLFWQFPLYHSVKAVSPRQSALCCIVLDWTVCSCTDICNSGSLTGQTVSVRH